MINGHGDDLYRYTTPITSNFSSNVFCGIDHSVLFQRLADALPRLCSYPEPEPASLESALPHSSASRRIRSASPMARRRPSTLSPKPSADGKAPSGCPPSASTQTPADSTDTVCPASTLMRACPPMPTSHGSATRTTRPGRPATMPG